MFKNILLEISSLVKRQKSHTRPTQAPRLTLEEALWTSLFYGYNSVPWEAVR